MAEGLEVWAEGLGPLGVSDVNVESQTDEALGYPQSRRALMNALPLEAMVLVSLWTVARRRWPAMMPLLEGAEGDLPPHSPPPPSRFSQGVGDTSHQHQGHTPAPRHHRRSLYPRWVVAVAASLSSSEVWPSLTWHSVSACRFSHRLLVGRARAGNTGCWKVQAGHPSVH